MYGTFIMTLLLLVTGMNDEVQVKLRALKEAARCIKLNLPLICSVLRYPEHQEQA